MVYFLLYILGSKDIGEIQPIVQRSKRRSYLDSLGAAIFSWLPPWFLFSIVVTMGRFSPKSAYGQSN